MDATSLIPEFEAKDRYPFGVLPDGVHACDEGTFRSRFVDRFPESSTRGPICEGFFLLRREALGFGIVATQWVDGSFVEGKPDPGDVDVVTFCDYDFLNSLATPAEHFAVECLNGRGATKARYHTHTFLVPSCGADHPYHPVFEAARTYWRHWFGKTRDIPNPPGPDLLGYPKGLVEMKLGDPARAPVIHPERGIS
jgi:hypothetical protein